MKTDQKNETPENLDELRPEVKEKAIAISSGLRAEDIPEGSSRMAEAIRRAEEWFTELEG